VAAVPPDPASLKEEKMLERLMLHGAALAHKAARARLAALAEALSVQAPEGVAVSEEEGAVALSGRGLRRRFALDPELRWLVLRQAQDERGRRR
jgi:hypothetical protein